jgi:cytochrome c-type biogenesis protein CcmH
MSLRRIAAVTMLVLAAVTATAQEVQPADEARYQALINELRCLVCQNQTIAESNAQLATDLRDQVRGQIAAGKSDAEILDFVTARYGDFVLYRPPFKARTWLLWIGPFVLLGGVAFVVVRFVRRSQAAPAPAAADPAAVKALLEQEMGKKP